MNILERLAFSYLDFLAIDNEFINNYYFIFITYPAALIFGFLKTVEVQMKRGTYFLNSAIILFICTLVQSVWLFNPQAIAYGFLFIIVAADILCWILAGIAYVYIAKARSNDAYGHSKFAILAFIPLGNLLLLFKGSKNKNYNPNETQHLTSGWPAVIIAFIIYFISGGLFEILDQKIDNFFNDPNSEELRIEIGKKYTVYYGEAYGLPKALNYMKSIEVIGQEYPDGTTLEDIIVEGNSITFMYNRPTNLRNFSFERKNELLNFLCNYNPYIIEQGATIKWHFYSFVNPEVMLLEANKSICKL